jgi:hypothetical protein
MPKKGYRPTQEHREKLSKSATGRVMPEEVRNSIRIALCGRKVNERTKRLMKVREARKRELYLSLLEHLKVSHPDQIRKEYKGYHKWNSCPICNQGLDGMKKVLKEKKEVIPVEQEVDLISKAIDDEMALGIEEEDN